jgi:hypothetical protein
MSVMLHLMGAEAVATSLLAVAAAGAVYLGSDWLSE